MKSWGIKSKHFYGGEEFQRKSKGKRGGQGKGREGGEGGKRRRGREGSEGKRRDGGKENGREGGFRFLVWQFLAQDLTGGFVHTSEACFLVSFIEV